MSIQSAITQNTPQKILFGAGVYFKGIPYSETVAPTEEAILAALIGATQEGGTLTVTPEFFDIPLDGAQVVVEELKKKIGEKSQMEVSFAEFTAEYAAKMVIGVVKESTDKNYDVVTTTDLGKGHFYEGFGFYGELLDGRPVIILYKKALCTSGMAADPKSKTNAVFKGTFECHSDLEYGVVKLPLAIFVRKAEGWTKVDPSEVAAA